MKGTTAAVASCSLNAWRTPTLWAFGVKHTCRVHVGRRRASAAVGFLKHRTQLFTQGHLGWRAKEMFSSNKNTVYPQKHNKRIKEQSLDERRLLETQSDASLQFAAAMH